MRLSHFNIDHLLCTILHNNMHRATNRRLLHPEESLESIAEVEGVSKATLHDRIIGTHAPRGTRANRNLSVVEEDALLRKTNAYANKGNLLTQRHVTQLAEAIRNTLLVAVGPQLFCGVMRTTSPRDFGVYRNLQGSEQTRLRPGGCSMVLWASTMHC